MLWSTGGISEKLSSQLSLAVNVSEDWFLSVMKIKWLSIALMVVIPLFSACADKANAPTPPLTLLFEVQKAGNKVETEFRVDKQQYYSFGIELNFKRGDAVDRERVKKLAGDHQIDKNGQLTDPGIKMPLKLIIRAVDNSEERIIFDKEILEQKLWENRSSSFVKLIDSEILQPGRYRISVESLKDLPELIGTPITFDIAFGHSK